MDKLFLLLTIFCCLIVPLEAGRNYQTKITPEIASYIVRAHNEVRATVSLSNI